MVLKDFRSIDTYVVRKHLQLASKGPFFQTEYDIDSGHVFGTRSESATSGNNNISVLIMLMFTIVMSWKKRSWKRKRRGERRRRGGSERRGEERVGEEEKEKEEI